jgi:hypothetical protein
VQPESSRAIKAMLALVLGRCRPPGALVAHKKRLPTRLRAHTETLGILVPAAHE